MFRAEHPNVHRAADVPRGTWVQGTPTGWMLTARRGRRGGEMDAGWCGGAHPIHLDGSHVDRRARTATAPINNLIRSKKTSRRPARAGLRPTAKLLFHPAERLV